MKTTIYILALILLIVSCKKDESNTDDTNNQGQTNNFIIDNSSIWTEVVNREDGAPYPYGPNYYIDTTSIYFSGDTVLVVPTILSFGDSNAISYPHQYKKLYYKRKQYKWYLPDENPSTSSGTLTTFSGVACYFRQDTANKRVFIVPVEDYFYHRLKREREYLLYDFNVNVGDTLPYNAWNEGLANKITIEEINQIIIDDKILKTYKIKQDDPWSDSIIEGIGSINGFLSHSGKLIHYHCKDFDYFP